MQENTIYFALKSKLRHRMNIDLKRNSMRNDDRFVFNLIIIIKKKKDIISDIYLSSGDKFHLNTSFSWERTGPMEWT